MLLGDTLLFLAGKWTGWTLLGFLCKVSANPETCILRSAESFYKRGKTTLVIAKFIPGVNTMGPPLAGSMKMPFLQFLRFDLMGAALYVSCVFHTWAFSVGIFSKPSAALFKRLDTRLKKCCFSA